MNFSSLFLSLSLCVCPVCLWWAKKTKQQCSAAAAGPRLWHVWLRTGNNRRRNTSLALHWIYKRERELMYTPHSGTEGNKTKTHTRQNNRTKGGGGGHCAAALQFCEITLWKWSEGGSKIDTEGSRDDGDGSRQFLILSLFVCFCICFSLSLSLSHSSPHLPAIFIFTSRWQMY